MMHSRIAGHKSKKHMKTTRMLLQTLAKQRRNTGSSSINSLWYRNSTELIWKTPNSSAKGRLTLNQESLISRAFN